MPLDIVYNSMPIKTVALPSGNAAIDSSNGYIYTKTGGSCTITFSAILELETVYFVQLSLPLDLDSQYIVHKNVKTL